MADTSAIPPDDPARKLTVADPDSPGVRHVAVVGDTYSILVSGADTAGRYCLIDMIVPDGGGPPPPIRTATPSSAAAVARDKVCRFIVVSLNNTHHMKRAFGPVATRS